MKIDLVNFYHDYKLKNKDHKDKMYNTLLIIPYNSDIYYI